MTKLIDCPACHRDGVAVISHDHTDRFNVQVEHCIRCGHTKRTTTFFSGKIAPKVQEGRVHYR